MKSATVSPLGAHGDDALALDEDVVGREVRDIALHHRYDASLEERAASVLRRVDVFPDAISAASPLSIIAIVELSAFMSDER
jgi:hypothetical protein